MSRLRARLGPGEAGLSLIELLVASAMSVLLVAAGGAMLISAVSGQPDVSDRAQKVGTARWVQERMTRELRGGIRVDEATPSAISFVAQVRSEECGGTGTLPADEPSRLCQVTYDCSSGTSCTRAEAEKDDVGGGVPRTLIGGLASATVFNYFPDAQHPTFVGVVLRLANSGGGAPLTVSDGATLRTPVLLSAG